MYVSIVVFFFGVWRSLVASQPQVDTTALEKDRHQRRIEDVLSSIEDRLRGDPVSYTLARLDFTLDQIGRRLGSIETRLDQLDWNKDGQTHCDKWNSQATYLEAKIDVHLSRVSAKLDSLERDVRGGFRGSPKAEDDGKVTCRGCTKLKDNLPIREMMTQVVTDHSFRVEDAVKWQIREQTAGIWEKLDRSLGEMEESLFGQINETLNSVSESCNRQKSEGLETTGREDVELLLLAVQKAITQSDTKFRKLDSDVELYTRKVMGSIRDLWASSDQVKVSLEEALRLGNRTRETVRYEFRKLHQQLEPLPRLEPRLAEVSATLHRMLGDLGATVDRSFATLLVAQNTFIDNCRRLHDEETHAYDVLQAVVHEMRNRSVSDMGRISADIRSHGDRLSRNFEAVLNAIFTVGNSTSESIGKLLPSLCSQMPSHAVDNGTTETTGETPVRSRTGSQKGSQDYEQDYQVPENDYVDI